MDDKELNDMYGMTAQIDENGILTMEDGKKFDLNQPKEIPIQESEISPIMQTEFKLAKKLRDFLKLDK